MANFVINEKIYLIKVKYYRIIKEFTNSSIITALLCNEIYNYSVFNEAENTVAARLTAKSSKRHGRISVYGYDETGRYADCVKDSKVCSLSNVDERRVEI